MLQLQALEDMRVLGFCNSGGQQSNLALVNQILAWTGLGCIMQLTPRKEKVTQVKQPDAIALPPARL